jgi:ABC-type uncharacterized transport system fused permease/ATPase subunit
MVTDEELVKMSYEIDEFLMDQVINYNISPTVLSGVIMARLVRMNEEAQSEESFYKLVDSISAKEHLKSETRVLQ